MNAGEAEEHEAARLRRGLPSRWLLLGPYRRPRANYDCLGSVDGPPGEEYPANEYDYDEGPTGRGYR